MPLWLTEISEIWDAATNGDLDGLRSKCGGQLPSGKLANLAFRAAMQGRQWHIIRAQVEDGYDINADNYAVPSLFWAVADDNAEAVQLLLGLGADVHKVDTAFGWTILIAALRDRRREKGASSSLYRSLLDLGADVNAADKDNKTVLMYAAQNGSAEHVRLLLERGANVNVRSRSLDRTALCYARRRGDAAMIALLEQAGCPE